MPYVPYADYDQMSGIRASDLKRMRESPLHYRNPAKDADTASRKVLRAIHSMVLEPWQFDTDFAVFYGRRAGKEFDALKERRPGAQILSGSEFDTVSTVSNCICTHPVAGPYFEHVTKKMSEVTILWKNRETELQCKARIDRITDDADGRSVILDLKSYGTTDIRAVEARVWKLGAHIQMAHYMEGAQSELGFDDPRVLIVSAETKPPYDVAVFELGNDVLQAGMLEREDLMRQVLISNAEQRWPGRYEEIMKLHLPYWASMSNADVDYDAEMEDGDYA